MASETKFYSYRSKRGISGVFTSPPRLRKQDGRARPLVMFACVFFPRLKQLPPASIYGHDVNHRMAHSAKAAILKFMDGKPKTDTWAQYVRAGWKVRRVKLIDMGPVKATPRSSAA